MGIIDEYMKELEEERLEIEKESQTDKIRMSELVPKDPSKSIFPTPDEVVIPKNPDPPKDFEE
jgi:hypothetical protein